MDLCFDPVQIHRLKAPSECRLQGFAHQPLSAGVRLELVAHTALAPAAVPSKEATGADQLGFAVALQRPAHAGVGQQPQARPGVDQRARGGQIGQRIGAKPTHGVGIAVDRHQGRRVGRRDLTQQQPRAAQGGKRRGC